MESVALPVKFEYKQMFVSKSSRGGIEHGLVSVMAVAFEFLGKGKYLDKRMAVIFKFLGKREMAIDLEFLE